MSHEIDEGSCLVNWINTFSDQLSERVHSLDDLCTGVPLAEILHFCAPSHFDLTHLSKSSDDSLSNVQLVCRELLHYVREVLEIDFQDEFQPEEIALSHSSSEVVRLCQTVLLAAVHSEQRQHAINNIMEMEEAEQQQIMYMLNDLMERYPRGGDHKDQEELEMELSHAGSRPASPSLHSHPSTSPSSSSSASSSALAASSSPSLDALSLELGLDLPDLALDAAASSAAAVSSSSAPASSSSSSSALDSSVLNASSYSNLDSSAWQEWHTERTQLENKVDSLSRELRELRMSHHQLQSEHDKAVQEHESSAQQAIADAVANALRDAEEKRKAEEKRAQRSLQESEQRLEELTSEAARLAKESEAAQRKHVQEAAQLKQQAQTLQDELDLSKEAQRKLARTEAQLEQYKLKLGNLGDVSVQLKLAEEAERANLERIFQLEQETKQIPQIKTQSNRFKAMVVELEDQLAELNAQLQTHNLEVSSVKNELQKVRSERDSLEDQVQALTEKLEVLKSSSTPTPSISVGRGLRDESSAEMNKKIMRLEMENKQLRESQSAEQSSMQEELDLVRARSSAHEERFVKAQMEIKQLKQALAAASTSTPTPASPASTTSTSTSSQLSDAEKEELARLRSDNQRLEQALMVASNHGAGAELAQKNQKLEQLTVRNSKLELFAKEAKSKVDRLRNTLQALLQTKAENDQLRKQLAQKDNELKQQERLRQHEKNIVLRERQLMSSAFYEMGVQFHTAMLTGQAARVEGDRRESKSWMNKQRARVNAP